MVMLAVKHFAEKTGQNTISTATVPTSLVAVLGIDVALDGLLVGLGFAAGQKEGLLLTIALTLEVLFLGLSGAVALAQAGSSRKHILMVTIGFALILLIGALAGSTLLVFASDTVVDAILAFGLAALLYLVTEELLVEAHEVPETSFQTAIIRSRQRQQSRQAKLLSTPVGGQIMDWNTELLLTFRILLAAVLGGLIGWERESHNRDAGVRTYMAVAVGSCAFSIVSNHIPGVDTRIAAQVVSGMGFIGAGVILQVRGRVQGLTTAATLWATAAVGMASAFGWANFIKRHHPGSERTDE
ncbi:conserved hypothetical protein [Ricinus communis]|uniref:MgtC/SapB/SrpB/YhiD N-terminal domain-containing protein n=1 Tax=Ricinus communis TaxID=3988 RepID=B9TDM3_RICCO|nr:conserved hypothetical protein [Ricinus communis]